MFKTIDREELVTATGGEGPQLYRKAFPPPGSDDFRENHPFTMESAKRTAAFDLKNRRDAARIRRQGH